MSSHWFTAVDHYCERTDAGFWSEPANALSNLAFLAAAAAAFALWRRAGGRDRPALWLVGVTALVGIGSFLFHTFANRWSMLADLVPIAVFIYSYFLLAMRRYLALSVGAALLATAAFAAFNMSFGRLWALVVGPITLNGSVGYLPAAGALFAVGALIPADRRQARHGLLAAAALFALSLTFRTVDHAVCRALPLGTHFVWHILTAGVLFVLMRTAILEPLRTRAAALRELAR